MSERRDRVTEGDIDMEEERSVRRERDGEKENFKKGREFKR